MCIIPGLLVSSVHIDNEHAIDNSLLCYVGQTEGFEEQLRSLLALDHFAYEICRCMKQWE